MSAPGYVLCVWSPPEGCWASIAVSEDRAKIEALAGRLARFTELRLTILIAQSVDDDDVVEASCELEAPDDVGFVRPPLCS